MSTENLVLDAKRCAELWFLVRQDKHVKSQPDEHPIREEARVPKKQALAKDRCYDRNVDGISYMTVEPAYNKVTRWEYGCRRTQALEGKPGKRVQQDATARNDENAPNEAKKRDSQQGRLNVPA